MLLGIVISGAFLYWTLKDVSWPELFHQVRAANLWLLGVSTVLATLSFPARAARWQWLIRATDGNWPAWRPTWWATAIGFMANNVLPARAGEIVRAYAGARLINIPVVTSLSTLIVDRVFDGVVIVILLAIGIASPAFPDSVVLPGNVNLKVVATTAGAVFTGLLIALAIVARVPDKALGLADRLIHTLLPHRLQTWAGKVARNIVTGLAALRSGKDFTMVLFWSFVVWLCNGVAFYIGFRSFHLAAPFTAALVLQGIVAFAVAVPSTPGYLGVFEVACVIALGIYGIPKEPATGFALVLHIAWFVPITIIGLWYLARAGLSLGQLRSEQKPA